MGCTRNMSPSWECVDEPIQWWYLQWLTNSLWHMKSCWNASCSFEVPRWHLCSFLLWQSSNAASVRRRSKMTGTSQLPNLGVSESKKTQEHWCCESSMYLFGASRKHVQLSLFNEAFAIRIALVVYLSRQENPLFLKRRSGVSSSDQAITT